MSKFTDHQGNEWEFRFSVPALIKVCRKLGLTLQDLMKLNVQIADILEALPLLLEDQIQARGITADVFLANLSGEDAHAAMKAAAQALQEAFPEVKIAGDGGQAPLEPGRSETSTS